MAGGIVLKPDGSPANIDAFTKYKLPTLDDLPPGWECASEDPITGFYRHAKKKLRVIVIVFQPPGRAQWIHVSYSHPKRTPNHDTTTLVKKLFIGRNREAIAVFPPLSRYVNGDPHCLHLWSPLDPRERSWPKFERYIDGVGNTI